MPKKKTSILRQRNGFTLIELLVVIAIIAILASILFPVFARARENARRTSCMSNLKQIGIGIMLYTQDYDERFPMYNRGTSAGTGTGGWVYNLQPYLKSEQIFQCPSESTGPTDVGGSYYSDYNYNLFLGWNGQYGSIAALAGLTSPTLTVAVADYTANSGYTWFTGDYGKNCGTTTCTPGLATFPKAAALRHLDGMNYVFTDGHSKWYKAAVDTTTPTLGRSASVYNAITPGTTSKQSPTFNPTP